MLHLQILGQRILSQSSSRRYAQFCGQCFAPGMPAIVAKKQAVVRRVLALVQTARPMHPRVAFIALHPIVHILRAIFFFFFDELFDLRDTLNDWCRHM